ncbi:MAG TPA: hypothetical protein VHY58_14260 [Streptosporangiaceae bacterium]|jgi:hypothetical protein|nr:hypothetical protein [Streptosporangiaceae bacterium]
MEPAIDSVTRWLHDLLDGAKPGGETQQAAFQALSSLAQPGHTVAVLRSLRARPANVSRLLARSYRHPLGFDQLALIDAAPRFRLRLHTWWPDSDRGTEHVHDHRYPPAAAILHGGYAMHLLRPDPVGVQMTEFREQPNQLTEGWQLDRIGDTSLGLVGTIQLTKGDAYALAADTLHQVVVAPGTQCLTLFLESTPVGLTTRVFAERGASARASTPKQHLTREDYLRILDAALTVITT